MANVNLWIVLLVVLVSMEQAETAENNGCFTFPDLPLRLALTAKENETITIPFQLRRNSACFGNGEEPKSIYISRPTKIGDTGLDICLLIMETGRDCRVIPNDEYCECPGHGNPNFLFTTTVTQDDHGTWTWRVGNDQSRWTKVLIDVQQHSYSTRNPQGKVGPLRPVSTGTDLEHVEQTSSSAPTSGIQRAKYEDTTVSSNDVMGVEKEGSTEGGVPGVLVLFSRNPQRRVKPFRPVITGAERENVEQTSSSVLPSGTPQNKDTTMLSNGVIGAEKGSVEGGFPGGLALFGGVFVGVNVFTVIAVATIVYVLRGRREGKRRHPRSALPPPPNREERRERRQQAGPVARNSSANSYIELLEMPESGNYEQIPAAFGADGNSMF